MGESIGLIIFINYYNNMHLIKFSMARFINPQFYIEYGGLWLLVFIIFAETGLFAGFFLPGDSLFCCRYLQPRFMHTQVIPSTNEFV